MNSPQKDDVTSQSQEVALEEYRQIVKERRFVMKSYMQAVALYLALAGYALKERSTAQVVSFVWVLGGLFTALNALALYAAARFKSMAVHATDREALLAARLQMKEPHSLLWGYGEGIILVLLFQAALTVTVAINSHWLK